MPKNIIEIPIVFSAAAVYNKTLRKTPTTKIFISIFVAAADVLFVFVLVVIIIILVFLFLKFYFVIFVKQKKKFSCFHIHKNSFSGNKNKPTVHRTNDSKRNFNEKTI